MPALFFCQFLLQGKMKSTLTRSFILEGLRLVLSDRFTDGEIGEPFHFNPPVPGRYPRARGLLIIHFIDYDYLIRKNILDTLLYSIRK